MHLDSGQIADITGARIVVAAADPTRCATSVSWDSRTVAPGALYLALPGERADGHDFIVQAVQAGACAVLASKEVPDAVAACVRAAGAALLQVSDVQAALTALAKAWRVTLSGTVLAVTGSSGKTTTKNLVRDVLASGLSVVATKGNQNNELGVPNTLLSAETDTQAVVVEMGMRGLGQIEELCKFVRPGWGLVTNVGYSHIELLGSRANIARAKAELLEALPAEGGIAFVNGADDMADFVVGHAKLDERGVSVVCFDGSGCFDEQASGWRGGAAVWAEDIQLDEGGCPSFTLCVRGFDQNPQQGICALFSADEAGALGEAAQSASTRRVPCSLSLRGLHNVSNACSAVAVGCAAGLSLETIVQALASALPESGRQELLRSASGVVVINDAYNANPDSMRAALSMFSSFKAQGRRVAVLGDMGELGEHAPQLHAQVGEFFATCGIDGLVCIGALSQNIAQAALAAGYPYTQIFVADSLDEAVEHLQSLLKPGDAVLVKASHSMGLEQLVERIVE